MSSSGGMDDIGRETAGEVEDQKEQTRRAVRESVQNYGDKKEEEGKKKAYRRALLYTFFTAIGGAGIWGIQELLEGGGGYKGPAPSNQTKTRTISPTETPEPQQTQVEPDFERVSNYLNREGIDNGYFEDDEAIHHLGQKMMQDCGGTVFDFGQVLTRKADTEGFGENYRLHHWQIDAGSEKVDDDEIEQMLKSADKEGILYLSDSGGEIPDDAYLATDQETYDRILEARQDINDELSSSDYLDFDEVTDICE